MKGLLQRLRARADVDATVPVFDGPLRPNQVLQKAHVIARLECAQDLGGDGERLYVADGRTVHEVHADGRLSPVMQAGGEITALACTGGGIAAAIDGTEVRIFGGRYAGRRFERFGGRRALAINALAADGARLIATDGSERRPWGEWRHDLMEGGRSGRVHALDLDSGASLELASGLGHAFGAGMLGSSAVVSESWRHRLLSIDAAGRQTVLLDQLPAYPSRLAPASDGGHWLSMFCARTQLVEFVLREPAYRRRMMQSIAPDLWIAPQLGSYRSFHEPLQYAALKQLGIVKPWAPPRSYGLVVKLDARGRAVASLHSRFGGPFHGIVAVVEQDRHLYLLSKGENVLIRLPLSEVESGLIP